MDLVTFLRVMLDRDEQVARLVENGPGEVQRRGLDPLRISVEDEVRFAYLTVDPARVLAEVEAKRQLIDEMLTECEAAMYDPMRGIYGKTLRALAARYADHPDYRDEWKP